MTDQDFEVRRQLVQLQMLYEVGLALGESLDPAHVAQEILQRALAMVDARAGGLLVREDDGGVVLAGHVGFADGAAHMAPLVEAAWRTAGPVQKTDVEGVGRHVCLVPLRSHGEAHGLLVVADKEIRGGIAAFTEADVALLDSFALQAGAALRNARLHRDLQAAFDALQAAQERIAQLEQLRALGDLAAEVTHAIRHVMGLVVGHADAWLTLKGDPQAAMAAILAAAESGQELIDRIHRVTRLGVGRERTHEQLNDIVADALARARGLAQGAPGVRWDTELVPELPRSWVNREDLCEAILNLLENALHAVDDHGCIRVCTASRGEHLHIQVTDDGPGIADAVRERLFEPFVTTRDRAGSGLGLSIVYRIITDHGGSVDVDSRPGHGATFTLHLPVVDTPPESCAETEEVLTDDGEEDPHRR